MYSGQKVASRLKITFTVFLFEHVGWQHRNLKLVFEVYSKITPASVLVRKSNTKCRGLTVLPRVWSDEQGSYVLLGSHLSTTESIQHRI